MKKYFLLLMLILYSCSTVTENESGKQHELTIATFNIQVFGQSKLGKPDVMQYIEDICLNYSAVAIQEIRSIDQNVIPALIDSLGENWDYVISERLGRTSSKEQYALVYRTDLITVDSTYQWPDPEDLIHREPFVAYCHSRDFTFSLINIHTDPDEVPQEVNALDDILAAEIQKEGDAILLGDLNAGPSDFGEILLIPNVGWAINDGVYTNTRLNKTYDNLIFDTTELTEFDSSGVFNIMTEFNIDEETALEISDHLPVWVSLKWEE